MHHASAVCIQNLASLPPLSGCNCHQGIESLEIIIVPLQECTEKHNTQIRSKIVQIVLYLVKQSL